MADPARAARLALVLIAGASLAACGTMTPRYPNHAGAGPPPAGPAGEGRYKVGAPYQVAGVWYVPREQPDYDQTGVASWYGDAFDQKPTANGEIFDMSAVSGAHTTLPLPSLVEVTNLDNGRRLVVRVNDRGPFVGGRIIDLSHEAARELGYDRQGLAHVRVRYVGPAPLLGPDAGVRYADARPLATHLPKPIPAVATGPAAASTASSAADPVVELAAGTPTRAAAVAAAPLPDAAPRTIAAPAAVSSQALPPLTGSAIASTPIPPPPGTAPAPAAPTRVALAGAPSSLRIQAGAYSNEANAQRAASQLATAGQASIEPVEKNGMTLYRVVIPAPADEAAAYALRDRVAEIGFADARVIQTF
jgi:rare lipoprotein A